MSFQALTISTDIFQIHPCSHKLHNYICSDNWIKFYCEYAAHFHCPFVRWWTSRLFLFPCYSDQSNNKHRWVSQWYNMECLRYMSRSGSAVSYGPFLFRFWETWTLISIAAVLVTLPSMVTKDSSLPTPTLALAVICVLDKSHLHCLFCIITLILFRLKSIFEINGNRAGLFYIEWHVFWKKHSKKGGYWNV